MPNMTESSDSSASRQGQDTNIHGRKSITLRERDRTSIGDKVCSGLFCVEMECFKALVV